MSITLRQNTRFDERMSRMRASSFSKWSSSPAAFRRFGGVLGQYTGRPLSELRADVGPNPEAHGEDHGEGVVLDGARNMPETLFLNLEVILTGCHTRTRVWPLARRERLATSLSPPSLRLLPALPVLP